MDEYQSAFMHLAAEEAKYGLAQKEGGPFGAVIVRKGEVLVKAHNEVIKRNDPTAHAEVMAIRKAGALLARFDLSDCIIYSSCEPCPMCLAAIHWAKIKYIYYGCTQEDAAKIGFDDAFLYEIIRGEHPAQKIGMAQHDRTICWEAFKQWQKNPNDDLS
ncbi:MAG: nucleoside deaminase [Thermonemataceae bacterium]